MLKRTSTIIAFLFTTFLLNPTAVARHSDNPRLGINVGGLGKLTSSVPFTDIFKMSRGWFTSCEYDWRNKQPLDPDCSAKTSLNTREQHLLHLDGNGWVRSLPKPEDSPVFTSVTSTWKLTTHFPTGRYVVLYDGQGVIKLSGDIKMGHQRPGHMEFDLLSPKRNLRLQITRTDPWNNGEYIRNIRIVPKKYEHDHRRKVFNPDYLARIRPMQAMRFMPWTNPRANEAVEWHERATIGAAHYTGDKGVPAERMVDLANAINATPWLSIPFKASDEYMRQYARMVKNRLRRDQKVYVEYSNEVWNTIFPAATYAARKADKFWNFPYKKEAQGKRRVLLAANWYAKRSVEMCRIWKNEFGTERNRVRCAVGTLTTVPWVGKEILDCPLWKQANGCGRHIDAYGVGPYFGDYIARKENRKQVKRWTRDRDGGRNRLFGEILQGGVLKNGPAGGAMARLKDHLYANKKLADKYGLEMVAYEGGQHLIRFDPPHTVKDPKVLNLFMSVQKDPRMGEAYTKYLQTWAASGGGLMLHYYGIGQPEPKNFFAMLDHLKQPSTPKYQALMSYLDGSTYVPVYTAPVEAEPAPVAVQAPVQQPVQQPRQQPSRPARSNTSPVGFEEFDDEFGEDGWFDNLIDSSDSSGTRSKPVNIPEAEPLPPAPVVAAARPPVAIPQRDAPLSAPVASSFRQVPVTGPGVNGWTLDGSGVVSPGIRLSGTRNHVLSIAWEYRNARQNVNEFFKIYAIDHRGGRKLLFSQFAGDIAMMEGTEQIYEEDINRYVGPPIRFMIETSPGLQAVVRQVSYHR